MPKPATGAIEMLDPWAELQAPPPNRATVRGTEIRIGSRVRLDPKVGGDGLTRSLVGKVAIVDGIEEDLEDRLFFAVRLEDDPGRDLGWGRQIGHRFFVSPEELIPLADEDATAAWDRFLVAGVGDSFRGDAGFGPAVITALQRRGVPDGVSVVDFGIRQMDFLHALDDGYAGVVVVEASPGGGPPGTVSVSESVRSGRDKPLVEVRCDTIAGGAPEPRTLSPPVETAIISAIEVIERVLAEMASSADRQAKRGGVTQ